MRWSARSMVGLVIVLLLLAGCASSKPAPNAAPAATATTPMSAGKVCQPIGSVGQTLTQLSGIGNNTTVGEVRLAQHKLAAALGLVGALPAAHGHAYDSLTSANEQLTAALAAVKNVPDATTVGQAGPQLQVVKAKATAAEASMTQLASAFDCKP